jgi:hypothetical protein
LQFRRLSRLAGNPAPADAFCPRGSGVTKRPSSEGKIIMADDLLKRGRPDRNLINMHEDFEVKYWTKHLGVSLEELKKAVEKVGNGAAAVRKELGKAA